MSAGDILRPWCSVLVAVKSILSTRGDHFNKPAKISFHCIVIQQLKEFNWLILLCFNWRIWKLQLLMQVTVNNIILKSRKHCMGSHILKPWSLQCLRENPKFGGNCLVSFLATAFCPRLLTSLKLRHWSYFFVSFSWPQRPRRFYGRLRAP